MEPRTRNLLLILLGAAVAFGGGCLYLGIKAHEFVFYKPSRTEKPHLYVTPEPIELTECDTTGGTDLSYFGYRVHAPWTGVKKDFADKESAGTLFESGQHVFAYVPSEEVTPRGALQQQGELTRRNMEQMLGPEVMRSNYHFYKAVFGVTPDELSMKTPFQRLIGLRLLLNMKDSFGRNADSGLYSFETQHVKGFQLGGPDSAEDIKLMAFDPDDRSLVIYVDTGKDKRTHVSQSELNCIIQSIRPAEEREK